MKDYIIRGISEDGYLRVFGVDTTETVRQAQKVHDLSPVAAAALGRTLSAAAMMSVTSKSENNILTIQIKGDGKLGGIVAVADADCNLKGYVGNPYLEIPLNSKGKLDVATAVGKGYLNIIMDLGLKEPYVGYVDLVSGEIAEDIAYYYASSEQIPTVAALGVLVGKDTIVMNSGGYIIQLMPGAGEDTIKFVEDRISGIKSVTEMLSEGKTPEEILTDVLKGAELKFFEKKECGYKCDCSRERMQKGIITLGRDEIISMIEDGKEIETHCHFCNMKYYFKPEELKELLKEASK